MNEFDYLAKAQDKMYDEKYVEVITLCDKALKINSELPDAYNFRGNANYELGKFEYAVEDFSQAIKRDSQNSEHYYDRSWAYKKMGNLEEAILDINKAIDIEPENIMYYSERARFEYWMERYKEAAADYTRGIEFEPNAKKYMGRGNCYMALDMDDLALADFNSALEFEPELHVAYFNKGLIMMRSGQYLEAIYEFEKAQEIEPDDDETCIRMGMCRVFMGKSDAIKYFTDAIKLNPCSDNYLHRIIARGRIAKREDSVRNLYKNKEIDADYDEDKVYNKKQAKDDIRDLNKIIALEPDEAEYYEMRSSRYSYLGNCEKVIADCSTVIELEPEYKNSYHTRAMALYKIGKYQDVIKNCDKYIELNGENINMDVLFLRATAEYKLKQYEKVVDDMKIAIFVKESCGAYYYRGLANYKLGHFRQAVSDIKKAIELKADVLETYDDKLPKLLEFGVNIGVNIFGKSKDHNPKTERPIGLKGIKGPDM